MHENRTYTLICGVYECLKWGFMLKKGAWRGIFEKKRVSMMVWETAGTVVLKENSCDKRKQLEPFMVRIPAVCFLMKMPLRNSLFLCPDFYSMVCNVLS